MAARFVERRLVERDPPGTVGFRLIRSGAARVRLALLRGGGSRAVAILTPVGGGAMAANPSRQQRARSELKRDLAYQALMYQAMPSYRSNKAVRAAIESSGDRKRVEQMYAAVRRARMLKRRPNPPKRGPKRSARTGRFVRG